MLAKIAFLLILSIILFIVNFYLLIALKLEAWRSTGIDARQTQNR
jgi:hypothetical protein